MVAAKSGQDALVLSALLKASADCNLLSRAGIDPLWLARRPGHVHVLLAARATIHGPSSTNPLNGVAGRGSADTVRVFLESRCDPAKASIDGFAPLHALRAVWAFQPGRVRDHTVSSLLAYRANVNVQCETQIKDRLFVFEVVRASVTVALWGLAHADPLLAQACQHSRSHTIDHGGYARRQGFGEVALRTGGRSRHSQ